MNDFNGGSDVEGGYTVVRNADPDNPSGTAILHTERNRIITINGQDIFQKFTENADGAKRTYAEVKDELGNVIVPAASETKMQRVTEDGQIYNPGGGMWVRKVEETNAHGEKVESLTAVDDFGNAIPKNELVSKNNENRRFVAKTELSQEEQFRIGQQTGVNQLYLGIIADEQGNLHILGDGAFGEAIDEGQVYGKDPTDQYKIKSDYFYLVGKMRGKNNEKIVRVFPQGITEKGEQFLQNGTVFMLLSHDTQTPNFQTQGFEFDTVLSMNVDGSMVTIMESRDVSTMGKLRAQLALSGIQADELDADLNNKLGFGLDAITSMNISRNPDTGKDMQYAFVLTNGETLIVNGIQRAGDSAPKIDPVTGQDISGNNTATTWYGSILQSIGNGIAATWDATGAALWEWSGLGPRAGEITNFRVSVEPTKNIYSNNPVGIISDKESKRSVSFDVDTGTSIWEGIADVFNGVNITNKWDTSAEQKYNYDDRGELQSIEITTPGLISDSFQKQRNFKYDENGTITGFDKDISLGWFANANNPGGYGLYQFQVSRVLGNLLGNFGSHIGGVADSLFRYGVKTGSSGEGTPTGYQNLILRTEAGIDTSKPGYKVVRHQDSDGLDALEVIDTVKGRRVALIVNDPITADIHLVRYDQNGKATSGSGWLSGFEGARVSGDFDLRDQSPFMKVVNASQALLDGIEFSIPFTNATFTLGTAVDIALIAGSIFTAAIKRGVLTAFESSIKKWGQNIDRTVTVNNPLAAAVMAFRGAETLGAGLGSATRTLSSQLAASAVDQIKFSVTMGSFVRQLGNVGEALGVTGANAQNAFGDVWNQYISPLGERGIFQTVVEQAAIAPQFAIINPVFSSVLSGIPLIGRFFNNLDRGGQWLKNSGLAGKMAAKFGPTSTTSNLAIKVGSFLGQQTAGILDEAFIEEMAGNLFTNPVYAVGRILGLNITREDAAEFADMYIAEAISAGGEGGHPATGPPTDADNFRRDLTQHIANLDALRGRTDVQVPSLPGGVAFSPTVMQANRTLNIPIIEAVRRDGLAGLQPVLSPEDMTTLEALGLFHPEVASAAVAQIISFSDAGHARVGSDNAGALMRASVVAATLNQARQNSGAGIDLSGFGTDIAGLQLLGAVRQVQARGGSNLPEFTPQDVLLFSAPSSSSPQGTLALMTQLSQVRRAAAARGVNPDTAGLNFQGLVELHANGFNTVDAIVGGGILEAHRLAVHQAASLRAASSAPGLAASAVDLSGLTIPATARLMREFGVEREGISAVVQALHRVGTGLTTAGVATPISLPEFLEGRLSPAVAAQALSIVAGIPDLTGSETVRALTVRSFSRTGAVAAVPEASRPQVIAHLLSGAQTGSEAVRVEALAALTENISALNENERTETLNLVNSMIRTGSSRMVPVAAVVLERVGSGLDSQEALAAFNALMQSAERSDAGIRDIAYTIAMNLTARMSAEAQSGAISRVMGIAVDPSISSALRTQVIVVLNRLLENASSEVKATVISTFRTLARDTNSPQEQNAAITILAGQLPSLDPAIQLELIGEWKAFASLPGTPLPSRLAAMQALAQNMSIIAQTEGESAVLSATLLVSSLGGIITSIESYTDEALREEALRATREFIPHISVILGTLPDVAGRAQLINSLALFALSTDGSVHPRVRVELAAGLLAQVDEAIANGSAVDIAEHWAEMREDIQAAHDTLEASLASAAPLTAEEEAEMSRQMIADFIDEARLSLTQTALNPSSLLGQTSGGTGEIAPDPSIPQEITLADQTRVRTRALESDLHRVTAWERYPTDGGLPSTILETSLGFAALVVEGADVVSAQKETDADGNVVVIVVLSDGSHVRIFESANYEVISEHIKLDGTSTITLYGAGGEALYTAPGEVAGFTSDGKGNRVIRLVDGSSVEVSKSGGLTIAAVRPAAGESLASLKVMSRAGVVLSEIPGPIQSVTSSQDASGQNVLVIISVDGKITRMTEDITRTMIVISEHPPAGLDGARTTVHSMSGAVIAEMDSATSSVLPASRVLTRQNMIALEAEDGRVLYVTAMNNESGWRMVSLPGEAGAEDTHRIVGASGETIAEFSGDVFHAVPMPTQDSEGYAAGRPGMETVEIVFLSGDVLRVSQTASGARIEERVTSGQANTRVFNSHGAVAMDIVGGVDSAVTETDASGVEITRITSGNTEYILARVSSDLEMFQAHSTNSTSDHDLVIVYDSEGNSITPEPFTASPESARITYDGAISLMLTDGSAIRIEGSQAGPRIARTLSGGMRVVSARAQAGAATDVTDVYGTRQVGILGEAVSVEQDETVAGELGVMIGLDSGTTVRVISHLDRGASTFTITHADGTVVVRYVNSLGEELPALPPTQAELVAAAERDRLIGEHEAAGQEAQEALAQAQAADSLEELEAAQVLMTVAVDAGRVTLATLRAMPGVVDTEVFGSREAIQLAMEEALSEIERIITQVEALEAELEAQPNLQALAQAEEAMEGLATVRGIAQGELDKLNASVDQLRVALETAQGEQALLLAASVSTMLVLINPQIAKLKAFLAEMDKVEEAYQAYVNSHQAPAGVEEEMGGIATSADAQALAARMLEGALSAAAALASLQGAGSAGAGLVRAIGTEQARLAELLVATNEAQGHAVSAETAAAQIENLEAQASQQDTREEMEEVRDAAATQATAARTAASELAGILELSGAPVVTTAQASADQLEETVEEIDDLIAEQEDFKDSHRSLEDIDAEVQALGTRQAAEIFAGLLTQEIDEARTAAGAFTGDLAAGLRTAANAEIAAMEAMLEKVTQLIAQAEAHKAAQDAVDAVRPLVSENATAQELASPRQIVAAQVAAGETALEIMQALSAAPVVAQTRAAQTEMEALLAEIDRKIAAHVAAAAAERDRLIG
ncbi:MAG: hypothetical protein HY586_06045, partial [Candidatus Omnitrophica bacterium]|nr:hypothetical protein [Candidatus Omnitrophota bacterium]